MGPGLDLDEAENLAFNRDDIDLTGAKHHVALDNAVALALQPGHAVVFSGTPSGPSVGSATEMVNR
jgi:hypothetical protein